MDKSYDSTDLTNEYIHDPRYNPAIDLHPRDQQAGYDIDESYSETPSYKGLNVLETPNVSQLSKALQFLESVVRNNDLNSTCLSVANDRTSVANDHTIDGILTENPNNLSGLFGSMGLVETPSHTMQGAAITFSPKSDRRKYEDLESEVCKKSELKEKGSNYNSSDLRSNVRISEFGLCGKSELSHEKRTQNRNEEKRTNENRTDKMRSKENRTDENRSDETRSDKNRTDQKRTLPSMRQPDIVYNSVMSWEESFRSWVQEAASKATQKNFRVQGNKFFNYLDNREGGKPAVPAQLKPYHLNDYKTFLMNNTSLSNNSIHTALMTVKSYCTWLYNDSVTTRNIGIKLKVPAYEPPTKTVITKEEIHKLFDVANYSQRLFLCFGFYMAMRVGALVKLQRKDILEIDLKEQTMRITWIAKGERRITDTFKHFDTLPEDWVEEMMEYEPERYLFPGRKRGKHLTERAVEKWMTVMGTKCKIQMRPDKHGIMRSAITPHDLRHAGATIIASESNGDPYQVKEHLHHKDIKTSMHYVHAGAYSNTESMLNLTPEKYKHK